MTGDKRVGVSKSTYLTDAILPYSLRGQDNKMNIPSRQSDTQTILHKTTLRLPTNRVYRELHGPLVQV